MSRQAAADRRQELLDAAVRVIAREGISGATTRAITGEAGVSLGYFHYVFTSHDEFMAAVIDEVTDGDQFQGESAGLAGIDVAASDPVDALLAGFDGYLDLLEDSPHREQAMLEITFSALRREGGQEQARRQYDRYRQSAVPGPRIGRECLRAVLGRPGRRRRPAARRDDRRPHNHLAGHPRHPRRPPGGARLRRGPRRTTGTPTRSCREQVTP
ncbi:TetR/AcrR family transcriptional regulator [Acidipropionibacterium acidipropionici]|uniref:TetR/AcrR family transcriptional regulator n=1 Tax=Acidipropionibacterium acidipropionici TaxID=1748 RepID=UPI00040C26F5|nr:TetR/AcrR family transcriptional regulator [Acidipropionibacterium acidipropionici]ALN14448.1 hypothetical protein ASQ49_03240 [Acidipropionibacterium acidipropionici]